MELMATKKAADQEPSIGLEGEEKQEIKLETEQS